MCACVVCVSNDLCFCVCLMFHWCVFRVFLRFSRRCFELNTNMACKHALNMQSAAEADGNEIRFSNYLVMNQSIGQIFRLNKKKKS